MSAVLYAITFRDATHEVEASQLGDALDVLLERFDLDQLYLLAFDGQRAVVSDIEPADDENVFGVVGNDDGEVNR